MFSNLIKYQLLKKDDWISEVWKYNEEKKFNQTMIEASTQSEVMYSFFELPHYFFGQTWFIFVILVLFLWASSGQTWSGFEILNENWLKPLVQSYYLDSCKHSSLHCLPLVSSLLVWYTHKSHNQKMKLLSKTTKLTLLASSYIAPQSVVSSNMFILCDMRTMKKYLTLSLLIYFE